MFTGTREVPRFSKMARAYLLQAGRLDWKHINPDIFGSMIQAIAEDEERAVLAHVQDHVLVDVDQFHGIEIEEFPAQIAQVAMWLMDHQMNLRVAEQFGETMVRLPLKKSAAIVHANALRIARGEAPEVVART